ncbi:hypothetical protein [Shewanella waksmanii]|uniref:hypothetical protein n=1 Tax=Shewanella waksmanii TaxID=213783 RepID=UPI00373521F1
MLLDSADMARLNELGDELKSTLGDVVQTFPERSQSISGLSELLQYNRSNSQRLINALNNSQNGLDVICLLPGVSSLNDFCAKAAQHLDGTKLDELTRLIELFQTKIKRYARSHSELKRLISASTEAKDDKPNLSPANKRADLFNAAKSLIGASVDTLFCSYILSHNASNDEYLQETAMIAKLGNVHQSFAPPFVQFYTHPHPNDFTKPSLVTADSVTQNAGFSIGVVDEYSTPGLFDAYASYSPSNSGIVFERFSDNRPFDATFVFDNPDELANPITHKSHCSSTSISIKTPTRKLVMLVFLEKHIDMRSTVNVGCYQGNQKVDDGHLKATDMWTERLPQFPDLKIVNLLSPQISSASGVDVVALTDYLFRYAQRDKQGYICYMMEVDYPIWSSTYRIYFEHE